MGGCPNNEKPHASFEQGLILSKGGARVSIMRKKTAIILYSSALIGCGLLVVWFGSALGNALTGAAGGDDIASLIASFGASQSILGLAGLGWAYVLPENPILPGYAGLSGGGLLAFLVGFLFMGPLWLVIAWVLWLFPSFKANASRVER